MLPRADVTTPEAWKPVSGFDGLHASDRARVLLACKPWDAQQRHLYDESLGGLLLRVRPDRSGYPYVQFKLRPCDRTVYKRVHVLMLMAFVGPRPPGMDGCHKDDDRLNNTLDNLYWGTRRQNKLDAEINHRNPRTIIPPEMLPEIYDLHDSGLRPGEIAKRYGVCVGTISKILLKSGRRSMVRFARSQVEQFEAMNRSGMSPLAIARATGFNRRSIQDAIAIGSARYKREVAC